MDVMEKIAGLPLSSKLVMLADSAEKVASERDELSTRLQERERELDLVKLCNQVLDSGQSPWATREEAMAGLERLTKEGRLDAFKLSLDMLPGSVPKLASGLVSPTYGDDRGGRKHNIEESRERVRAAIEGAAVDG